MPGCDHASCECPGLMARDGGALGGLLWTAHQIVVLVPGGLLNISMRGCRELLWNFGCGPGDDQAPLAFQSCQAATHISDISDVIALTLPWGRAAVPGWECRLLCSAPHLGAEHRSADPTTPAHPARTHPRPLCCAENRPTSSYATSGMGSKRIFPPQGGQQGPDPLS